MDVTLRVVVILGLTGFLIYFLRSGRKEFSNLTKGLFISLVASIIFFFEGLELFRGVPELERLPLCLLVLGIWGISFYFYYKHFTGMTGDVYPHWHEKLVFVLVFMDIVVPITRNPIKNKIEKKGKNTAC